MMENAYGAGHGMQMEVLEHRFKEIEKKLDKCATEYRKTLIKIEKGSEKEELKG
jgi:hypothetical protein